MFSIKSGKFMKSKLIFVCFTLLLASACKKNDSPQTISLAENWRFCPDEKNVGKAEKWYAVDFDDSRWKIIKAGERWEDQAPRRSPPSTGNTAPVM